MESILAKALGQDATQLATEEKQRLLSRLLGRLAHEIRNPLSSLDIHLQLLEEDLNVLAPALREKLDGRLDILQGELKRLDTIVKHFLRLAAPSELHLEPVDLARLARQLCALLGPEAAARGAVLETRLDQPLPAVLGDPVQLTQALMNLVVNALQAVGHEGRVEVLARAEREAVVVTVRDNGPGLPAGKLQDIFEPYFTTKPDGNGLGLWIAQQISTAHKGEILVSNAPGGGAIFELRLPVCAEDPTHG